MGQYEIHPHGFFAHVKMEPGGILQMKSDDVLELARANGFSTNYEFYRHFREKRGNIHELNVPGVHVSDSE